MPIAPTTLPGLQALPLPQRVLAIAASQIGVAETPGTPNRGPIVDAYRGSATSSAGDWMQPWCASFVSWTFNQAGAPLVDHDGDTWSARIGDWARQVDRYRDPEWTPAPGDVVLFRFDHGADRWANHVGIVESIAPDGTLTTIEGNVRDAVRQLNRSRERVVGFVTAE